MKELSPVVSVLLPVYNGMPYLPETVDSIMAQTDPRWILYALDDGSTDDSASYLDSLTDPRIVVVHHENRGLSETLNQGLKRCRTPYVARVDADDVCHPQRFEKQIAWLDAHPEVGLLGSQIRRMGTVRTDSGSHLPTSHDEIMAALLDGQHAICHPAIMCRREAYRQFGEYQPGVGEDWDLYLKVGEHWRLANHPECLLNYRFHGSSINGARMAEMRQQIRFHCENARRRMAHREEISFEEFVESENRQNWLSRLRQRTEDLARARYNAAVADLLGEHRLRGWVRLAAAAVTAPQLTWMRMQRKLRGSGT
jgi:glycosyltransferase involved in cell wall biosynthesis